MEYHIKCEIIRRVNLFYLQELAPVFYPGWYDGFCGVIIYVSANVQTGDAPELIQPLLQQRSVFHIQGYDVSDLLLWDVTGG